MPNEQYIIGSFLEGKLEPFYNNIYPGLLLYAKKILGAGQGMYAEDCVQNAVYKVWKRKDNLSSAVSSSIAFKVYFYMAIRNEALNVKRKNLNHEKYLAQFDDTGTFISSVIENEVWVTVFEAVKTLEVEERRIIEMSYMSGMKNHEIEQELGLSLASVKRRKAKAIISLRKKLCYSFCLIGIVR